MQPHKVSQLADEPNQQRDRDKSEKQVPMAFESGSSSLALPLSAYIRQPILLFA